MRRRYRALVDWWRRRRVTRPRIPKTRRYGSRVEVPDDLPRRVLAVVGTEDHVKWAIMECPCGRGHQLLLPLQSGNRPHWRLFDTPFGPELAPSVDSLTRYRCHFSLRRGRVYWFDDD